MGILHRQRESIICTVLKTLPCVFKYPFFNVREQFSPFTKTLQRLFKNVFNDIGYIFLSSKLPSSLYFETTLKAEELATT